ncbi:hypothetical protein CDAR_286261 [Caerostris darwini]|uniref:Uncharacterized protein n=1 Tax=Caerostris darwini TaxID=1538125 RepID=A0AAV4W0T3_9ARAC|nr:hypothetical protein CDAR_286261 [Caerostris darwini]
MLRVSTGSCANRDQSAKGILSEWKPKNRPPIQSSAIVCYSSPQPLSACAIEIGSVSTTIEMHSADAVLNLPCCSVWRLQGLI